LCACGPAGMVDGRLLARLTPQKLDAIMAEAAQ
jgi:NADH:ubiquinone oxidoreductase subunit E